MESHKLFLTRKCACTGEQVDTCLSRFFLYLKIQEDKRDKSNTKAFDIYLL